MRVIFVVIGIVLSSCSMKEIQKGMEVLSEQTGSSLQNKMTPDLAASGLKEALKNGAKTAGEKLSKTDGFLKDSAIKILFPPQFHKAEKRLRKLGLSKLADKAILSFNRAAESASDKAFPILAAAVSKMTFKDAMNILLGADDSATTYLKKTTSAELTKTFYPVVKMSSDKVSATRYWKDIANHYNQIPFVEKIPRDINAYITQKTMDGLFLMIKKKEGEIREDPIARTTDLLKTVFGYAAKNKN